MSTADDRYAEEERTRTGVGLVLGLWLSGVFAASLGGWFEHGRDNQPAMALLCAAIVWPLGYFLVSRHRFMPQPLPFGATVALATFVLISALSSFMSPVILRSTGYVVLTVAGLWVALQFNSALDREDYERGLRTFVLLTGVLLVGFAWFDYVPGKRLGTGKDVLNPNTIALVSTSVLLAAMAFRTLVLRLAAMAPIAGIIVLTSSRAATAATVAGLATIVWLRLRAKGKPALRLAGIGLLVAALLAAAYGEVLYRVLDQFYALSTADRGLGSGATGRTAAWKATWDLFVRNPALGVGFRAHEQSLGVDSSAHNGYLATLAEIGLPGFLAVLYLVARGMRLLRAGAKEPETGFTHSLLFGFCIAYLILAVFERYLINVGNPTSLLFLLCLMRPDGAKADVMQEDESWLPSEETSDDADPAAAGA